MEKLRAIVNPDAVRLERVRSFLGDHDDNPAGAI